ncbi:hypothetical protein GCM10010347_21710 [Streptomyces cirratus]|uniref:Glyoxalase/fosfomycin resistance/dioxygenase domain-containing protein n=1 Tax=Streptomyces cirratus TaxID=68187 RepID=A0ABQ3EUR2_9ACTN|nr:VOC family protein [Streptomyces cirratus]GHB51556.1 hypothetical protein GCM10010347_21710 [Streptomyces cirratus]
MRLGAPARRPAARRTGRTTILTVAAGSAPKVILWPRAAAAGQSAGAPAAPALAPVFLESDDLRADFEALRARGVTFEQAAPEDYPSGVRIEAGDPDGNRLALRRRGRAGRARLF